jgi:hypothetical protein
VHTVTGANEEGLRSGVLQHSGDKWSSMSGGISLASSSDTSSAPAEDARAAAAAAAAARFATAAVSQPSGAAAAVAPPAEGSLRDEEKVKHEEGNVDSAEHPDVVFGEDLGEAQAQSSATFRPLLVFATGDFDDEAVDRLEETLWGDPKVRAAVAAKKCIPVLLAIESGEGKAFAEVSGNISLTHSTQGGCAVKGTPSVIP